MLGFIGSVVWGAGKLGVKYIILPAIISVGIAVAADALAARIRERTPTSGRRLETEPVLPGF